MSCKHGNWSPCEECDEEDAAIDAAYKRGYIQGGIDAALSARPAQAVVADGWQDIATAPKDGTVVLIYNAAMIIPYMNAQWEHGRWCGMPDMDGSSPIWRSATHWRPMPEPPK